MHNRYVTIKYRLLYQPSQNRDCATGWTTGVWFPIGGSDGILPPHHRVQTGFGAHPATYPIGTRGSFPTDAWSWPLTFI